MPAKIKWIFLVSVIFIGSVFVLIPQRNIRSFGAYDHHVYLPSIMTPCDSYAADIWVAAPNPVMPGAAFVVTVFLRNEGCSTLSMPIYEIQTVPDISPSPYQHSITIEPNQIDKYEVVLTAPTVPLTLEVLANASFEVNYPTGEIGYGSVVAPEIMITVHYSPYPAPPVEQLGDESKQADIVEHESLVTEEVVESATTPELGILESGIFFEAHVPREVKVENIWQGYVNGNLTRIYAGQARSDTRLLTSIEKNEKQFGAVYIMTFWSGGKVETGLYTTEKEGGALRIREATQEFLVLESTGTQNLTSQVYYYGLNARRLVDSFSKLDTPSTPTPIAESYP